MNSKVTGEDKVTTAALGEVLLREVPMRRMKELYPLTDLTTDGDPLDKALGQVRLYTTLTEEDIDKLSHAEVVEICEKGLKVNAAFFPSFAAAMRKQFEAMAASTAAAAAPSPSTTGSMKGAPSPA